MAAPSAAAKAEAGAEVAAVARRCHLRRRLPPVRERSCLPPAPRAPHRPRSGCASPRLSRMQRWRLRWPKATLVAAAAVAAAAGAAAPAPAVGASILLTRPCGSAWPPPWCRPPAARPCRRWVPRCTTAGRAPSLSPSRRQAPCCWGGGGSMGHPRGRRRRPWRCTCGLQAQLHMGPGGRMLWVGVAAALGGFHHGSWG